ncbi:hypothetical protein CELL_01635 [Cellulomonas sp. T2.31MG-18]
MSVALRRPRGDGRWAPRRPLAGAWAQELRPVGPVGSATQASRVPPDRRCRATTSGLRVRRGPAAPVLRGVRPSARRPAPRPRSAPAARRAARPAAATSHQRWTSHRSGLLHGGPHRPRRHARSRRSGPLRGGRRRRPTLPSCAPRARHWPRRQAARRRRRARRPAGRSPPAARCTDARSRPGVHAATSRARRHPERRVAVPGRTSRCGPPSLRRLRPGCRLPRPPSSPSSRLRTGRWRSGEPSAGRSPGGRWTAGHGHRPERWAER